MTEQTYILSAIAVTSFVTILLRFAPFIIFRNKIPKVILYLGQVLPEAIMVILVIYCLKGISLSAKPYGIPEILSLGFVYLIHQWKQNTLLSILAGTLGYMFLIQYIFI